MNIVSPFHLLSDAGHLSVDNYRLVISPGLTIAQFKHSDLFRAGAKTSRFPNTDEAFTIGPIRLPNGIWFYLNLGFSQGVIAVIGSGWGKVRDGFYEATASEFNEQLQGYKAWLESGLGPSLPCKGDVVYRSELPWGSVEASSDMRSKLPGIGMRFRIDGEESSDY